MRRGKLEKIIEDVRKFRESQGKLQDSELSCLEKSAGDPCYFVEKVLAFKPLSYQRKILLDQSRRVVIRVARQGGKTTILAAKALWYAAFHANVKVLIVAPSLRQAVILRDNIESFINRMPEWAKHRLIKRALRETIYFRNGSNVKALPGNPNTIRGLTAHMLIVDEGAFFHDDELMFYSVLLPMLSTTNGQLIVSSTPWNRDSVFYKMFQSDEFSKHVITWRDVVREGLFKPGFIDEMRKTMPAERFAREYGVEFIEDASSYFPQDLISRCIISEPLNWNRRQWDYLPFEATLAGNFVIGIDLGKKVDHSAIAVLMRIEGNKWRLVHLRCFPLETEYASVIGYTKVLCDRYRSVNKVLCDQTGVGEYIVEDMARAGIPNVEGVVLTVPRKEEVLGHLKQQMQTESILFPCDEELIPEIHGEKFEPTKDGHIRFSHAEGMHDDRLWALALACYASRSVDSSLPIAISK